MLTVFIVIHILIAVGLIGLILLQKSEGNSAGGGFSVSSMTTMMQPRARPNPLSRATTILGIGFFVTSLSLALISKTVGPAPSILDVPGASSSGRAPRVDEVRTPAAATPAAAPGAPATPGGPTAAEPAAPVVPTVPKN
ncbi:MAG: preprotein translocase subunit SecG [Rhodospirillaceae bacterium]